MILPDDFVFTQSNLQDYLDCPYRFYLRHIRHTRWPALVVDDAAAFEERGQIGARFHRLLQQYLLEVPETRLTDLAAADPSLDILNWWQDFLINVPPWLDGTRWVEATLHAQLAGFHLAAKYDLVLAQPPDGLVIFDWKTSKKRPRKEWLLNRVQTRIYRFILCKSGSALLKNATVEPEQITMQYWYAAFPTAPISLPYDARAYEKDQAFFTRLVNEISSRKADSFFRTEETRHCRFCVYRSHCDRGTQAGDLAAFEDEELENETDLQDLDFEAIEEIEF